MTTSSSGDDYEVGPLGEPVIREANLADNATLYESLAAMPSQETTSRMWLVWNFIFFLIAAYATIIFLPIAFTKKIRKKPFNLYLIYLMIPDVLATWGCAFNCLANYLTNSFAGGAWVCYFQSFYLMAWVSINAWLNACIARQLLTMLQSSKRYIKYQPPTHCRVSKECILVYLFGLFVASWGVYGDMDSWWPHKTVFRIACLPTPVDDASMVFHYVVFFPALVGIPFFYVLYASYVIWNEGLLPPPGRRRTLAVYFFRLALVFVGMWIPSIILLFVTPAWTNAWVEWFGGTWGHMQVAVSATVSLMKPDMLNAFKNFYTCQCVNTDLESERTTSTYLTSIGTSLSFGSRVVSGRKSRLIDTFNSGVVDEDDSDLEMMPDKNGGTGSSTGININDDEDYNNNDNNDEGAVEPIVTADGQTIFFRTGSRTLSNNVVDEAVTDAAEAIEDVDGQTMQEEDDVESSAPDGDVLV